MTPLLAPLQSTATPASPDQAAQSNMAADGDTFETLLTAFSNSENRTPEDDLPDQTAVFAGAEDQVVIDPEGITTDAEDIVPAVPDRARTDAADDTATEATILKTNPTDTPKAPAAQPTADQPTLTRETPSLRPDVGPSATQTPSQDVQKPKLEQPPLGQKDQPIADSRPLRSGQAKDAAIPTTMVDDQPPVSPVSDAPTKANQILSPNAPSERQGRTDQLAAESRPTAAGTTAPGLAQSPVQDAPQTATQVAETGQRPGPIQNVVKEDEVAKPDILQRSTSATVEQRSTTPETRGTPLPVEESVASRRQPTPETPSRTTGTVAPQANPEKAAQTILPVSDGTVSLPTTKDGTGQDSLVAKPLPSQVGTPPAPGNPTSSAQIVVQSGLENAAPRPLKTPAFSERGKISPSEKADLSQTAQPIPRTPQDTPATQTPPLVAGQADVIKQASRQTGAAQGTAVEGSLPLERADPSFRFEASSPVSDRAVSSTSAQTPATPADQARQIAQQLAAAMPTTLPGTTEITLQPEELGRVRMTLTVQEGALALVIHADRPETSDLMRRHIDQLMQAYRQMGFDTLNFSFAGSEQGQATQTPEQQLTTETDIAESDPTIPGSVTSLNAAPQGRLDLRM